MKLKKKALLAGIVTSLFATSALSAATHYIGLTTGAHALGGSVTFTDGAGVAGGTSIWDLSTAPVDALTGRPTVTLTTGNDYILENVVFVIKGDLKINDGVIIRGQPMQTSASFDGGALAISATAKIYAIGTATNPIIFTSAATSSAATGNKASGGSPVFFDSDPKNSPKQLVEGGIKQNAKWGGLIVLGNAPTNIDRNLIIADNPASAVPPAVPAMLAGGAGDDGDRVSFHDENNGGNVIFRDDRSSIEGVPTTATAFANGVDRFGGNNNMDNSGILRYVSIRFAGSNLGTNLEINGLTMGGVGAGTFVDYIEIFGSSDDGIEIFGGSVNMTHLCVMGVEDDMFDFDAGYTGYAQFLFGVGWGFTGSTSTTGDFTDRAFEWDGSYRFERPEGFRVSPAITRAISAGGVGAVTSNQNNIGNVVLNATIIGNTFSGSCPTLLTASASSGHSSDNNDRSRGLMIRDQASPIFLNSIVVPGISAGATNFTPYGLRLATIAPLDYTASVKRLESGRAQIKSNTWYHPSMATAAALIPVAGDRTAGSNGALRSDALAADITPHITTGSQNIYGVDPFDPAIYGGPNNTLNENLTSGFIDPRPLDAYASYSGTPALLQPVPLGSGAEQVLYRGAFSDDFGSNLWTTGWTAANKLGRISN